MAKNNKPQQKGAGKKEAKAPKAPEKAPKKADEPVVIVPEEKEKKTPQVSMASNTRNLTDRKYSGLSPDGQVRLLDLTRRTFVEEKDPDLQFPQSVRRDMNRIVAVGILCTIAEHAQNGDNQFAQVLASTAYPTLMRAAKDMGIEIPEIKALPAGPGEGTVQLPASSVKISKETKEELAEEKKIREGEKPELDPEKISSEDDLRKALKYMFVEKNCRLVEVLLGGIDFMKKFRLHEASLAENAEEAKKKFESRNSGEWLDDLFQYAKPSIFFRGIGRGMAHVTQIEKAPIHAFTIFRDAIKDKDGNLPIDDQEIAYCVRSIIKWFCNTNIESNQKVIDNLDPKKNEKEIETCKKQIADYNAIFEYITNPSSDGVDNMLDNIGSHFDGGGQLTPECQNANQLFNRVCKTYYGKQLSDADYSNLTMNVQQYAGSILNLFRNPGAQNKNYSLSNISDLVERTQEEKDAIIKEAKKAWAEKKKTDAEKSEKNA